MFYLLNAEKANTSIAGIVIGSSHATLMGAEAACTDQLSNAQKKGTRRLHMVIVEAGQRFPPGANLPREDVKKTFACTG